MVLRDYRGNLITPPLVGATKYEYDCYSGSQISVMFGDVVVDDAVSIQFRAGQTKTPVWGYANQYYTFVAKGRFLAQGTLTIGFKEWGYLLWPMKRFINLVRNNQWTSPRYSIDKNGNIVRGYDVSQTGGTLTSAAAAAANKEVMQANVEQMMEWGNPSGDALKEGAMYNQFYRELGALPDDKFEDWAEVFEDAIWYGSDTKNVATRDKLFSRDIPDNGIPINNETILTHRRPDQYPPIDIWIVYGDMSRPAANHTVRKLLDVSFTDESQVIEISGEPIYEQYTFIARNLV
jgi:hypothetical protein